MLILSRSSVKTIRAEYGKQIVATVSRQLAEEFGSGFEEKSVRRMMQFATEYQDFGIVATLSRQLPSKEILLRQLQKSLEVVKENYPTGR